MASRKESDPFTDDTSHSAPFESPAVRPSRLIDSEDYIAPKSTWKGRIWDTLDKPPAERRMLFKVDAVILTFASLGYFLKNLDQTNVNSAFVSGMKEDLNMYGEELVTSVTIWTVGYVLGQIPTNLLLTRISPRWVIPALEIGWGIATLGSYAVQDIKALYALRFLVGLFEAGFYPGIHYILGGWYTPQEIGKRATIFWLAGSVGQMFSGILQAAAYTHLNGVNGLVGWRWLFIIDAIITLPIAIAGFIFFPPDPQFVQPSTEEHDASGSIERHEDTLEGKVKKSTKPWWLTEDEMEIARARMRRIGRAGKKPWTVQKVKRLAFDWHTWMLPMVYVLWNNGYPQPPIAYWLKAFNNKTNPPRPGVSFTVQQINQSIQIVACLITAWLSDGYFNGNRTIFIHYNAIGHIILSAIILKRDVFKANITGTMVLYWFSTVTHCAGPLILSWINEICSDDTEKRALLVAAANDLAYVVQAIAPNFVWKTTDFPQATKGWTWTIVLAALLIVWTAMVQILLARDKKKKRRQEQSVQSAEDVQESTEETDGKEKGEYSVENTLPDTPTVAKTAVLV